MSRWTRLRAGVELVLPPLWAVTRRLWSAPDLTERYAEYLCVMHGVIRASVPIMELAGRECAMRGADDPVARALAGYLSAHAQEERGHDEWIRQDLAMAGFDPDEPLRRMPSPEVAVLVGAQYYWVRHHHPVCLLGYIALLEGYPPTPALVERLVTATGLAPGGFRTLSRHALLDPRHRDDLAELLDALPLAAAQEAAVLRSALHAAEALTRVFEGLLTCRPAVPKLLPGGRDVPH